MSKPTAPLSHPELVRRCEEYVRAQMGDEPTGHDWWHAVRVRNLAVRIAGDEGLSRAEIELAEITGLLHDLEDEKFSGSETAGPAAAAAFLRTQGCDEEFADAVADIISKISFHGARVEDKEMSLVGQCVRDADRLDAMGDIGIARAFAYGGHFNRAIHDPDMTLNLATSKDSYRNTKGTTINHFYEKLLLLRDRMTTTTGRRIAEGRHQAMVDFLDRFDSEWDGLD
jgi:uncharacterized protein